MARKGINKAIESQFQFFENRRLLSDTEYSKNRTCIFISHKKGGHAKGTGNRKLYNGLWSRCVF